jgi:hypothetical protein
MAKEAQQKDLSEENKMAVTKNLSGGIRPAGFCLVIDLAGLGCMLERKGAVRGSCPSSVMELDAVIIWNSHSP